MKIDDEGRTCVTAVIYSLMLKTGLNEIRISPEDILEIDVNKNLFAEEDPITKDLVISIKRKSEKNS